MSGKALNRIREILQDTSCYRLTGSGSADWEVTAYGAGFGLLEDELEGLLGDLFASTASEGRLAAWERALWGRESAGTLEDRRAVLAGKLAVTPRSFTPERLGELLAGAGVQGVLEEGTEGISVLLGRLLSLTQAEAERELSRLLPAHLGWTWENGVHWAALDACVPDFETLDGLNLTWTEWDGLTRDQLEQWNGEEN